MIFHSIAHSFDPALDIRIWCTTVRPNRSGDFVVLPDARADVVVRIDRSTGRLLQVSYTGFDLEAVRPVLAGNTTLVGLQFDASTCPAAREIMAGDRLEAEVVRSVTRAVMTGEPFDCPGMEERVAARRDEVVVAVIRDLERNPHRDRIARVSARIGVSIRTIERRFVASTGRTPTDFVRIYRFLRLKRLMRTGESGASIALRAGYSDQAHMCREVKRVSAMTLRRLASRLPDAFG